MELNSLLHQQHRNVYRYSGSFIYKETRSSVQHFNNFSTPLQVNYLKITLKYQPIYIPNKFSVPIVPIEIINIVPPNPPISYYLKNMTSTTAFNKPLILYQFQSNIHPIINQDYNILSISEHYPAQNPTSLWSYINFRSLSTPAFNNPLISYQIKIHIL